MEITRDLLHKYAEGRCSPEEILAIEEWLKDGEWPENLPEMTVTSHVRHSIWNKVEKGRAPEIKKRIRWQTFMRVAAILLLIAMGAGSTVYYFYHRSRKDELVYLTAKDARRMIILSDSSVVFLAPRSSIRLLQPFSGGKREIMLNGEASFEVAKDPLHPFTVVAGTIHTTALGTSFKVSAPASGDSVRVALSSGRVVVSNQPDKEVVDQLFLDPGEGATYERSGHLKKTGVRQYNYKEDILYFRNAGVKEVMDKLAAFYHVQVRYEALKDVHWQVSGEFDYQPIDIILQNIAYTCDVRYTLEKGILTLRKN